MSKLYILKAEPDADSMRFMMGFIRQSCFIVNSQGGEGGQGALVPNFGRE